MPEARKEKQSTSICLCLQQKQNTHDPQWSGSPASQGLRMWKLDEGANCKQCISGLRTCYFWEVDRARASKCYFSFEGQWKKMYRLNGKWPLPEKLEKTSLTWVKHGDEMPVTIVLAQAKSTWCGKLVRNLNVNKALRKLMSLGGKKQKNCWYFPLLHQHITSTFYSCSPTSFKPGIYCSTALHK